MRFKHSDTSDKLKPIRLLLLDTDGVLTDGTILYTDAGEEAKAFNVRDGLGIRLLIEAGVNVGIVTGRRSKALRFRCKDLDISLVFEGIRDKGLVLDQILEQTGLAPNEIGFVGDDVIDIPLMRRVGVSVAVANADPMVMEYADMVTELKGGWGAVREVCEAILKAKGLWESAIEKYKG